MEQTFFQAYRNWLRLLSSMADAEVMAGWHAHHEHMITNPNFSTTFEAWLLHDRQLHTSFFNAPFILNMDSTAYAKGFDCTWLSSEVRTFHKERSSSPIEHHSFRGSSAPAHSQNNACSSSSSMAHHYVPYDKPTSDSFREPRKLTLCLRCGNTGHQANKCSTFKPSKPNHQFFVKWKSDRLVTIKYNKHICVLFNVRGFCNDKVGSRHSDHSCSLCGDTKHGAMECTHNWPFKGPV